MDGGSPNDVAGFADLDWKTGILRDARAVGTAKSRPALVFGRVLTQGRNNQQSELQQAGVEETTFHSRPSIAPRRRGNADDFAPSPQPDAGRDHPNS